MIARRLDCQNENPDVEEISENRVRVTRGNIGALDKLLVDTERVDRANIDLLRERQWREMPGEVLRDILRELDYPRPDNVTRG
jgi:hypothetical protein